MQNSFKVAEILAREGPTRSPPREAWLLARQLLVEPRVLKERSVALLTPPCYIMLKGYREIPIRDPGKIILKGEGLFENPLVKAYHEYILRYWRPYTGNRLALLTPCSPKKPYSKSFMYVKLLAMLRKLGVDLDHLVISEPLVMVPFEVHEYFPAANYDYPPSMVSSSEKRIYVELLARIIEEKLASYDHVVYFLPRFHKAVFEEAMEVASRKPQATYVPYNVFFLPRLRDTILRLASRGN